MEVEIDYGRKHLRSFRPGVFHSYDQCSSDVYIWDFHEVGAGGCCGKSGQVGHCLHEEPAIQEPLMPQTTVTKADAHI